MFRRVLLIFVQRRKMNPGFVTSFEKYAKIKHFHKFLKKSFENFRKFSQNSPTLCVFGPNPPKITHGLLNFIENKLK